jgi:hypothetical protein
MPGGNSTARPNNRKENQARASINSRQTTIENIQKQIRSGDIRESVGNRKIRELLNSKGAKKDYDTFGDRYLNENIRKIGKEFMDTPETRTKKAKGYNKGGYCGASNPPARPMKKGK